MDSGAQHLQRDLTIEAELACPVHHPHAAPADFFEDFETGNSRHGRNTGFPGRANVGNFGIGERCPFNGAVDIELMAKLCVKLWKSLHVVIEHGPIAIRFA